MTAPASIQRKLKAVILATCAPVVVITCGAFMAYDWISSRADAEEELRTLSRVVGRQSEAALAFHDAKTAHEILSSLGAVEYVTEARLVAPDGAPFASYAQPESSPAPGDLEVVFPIELGGNALGRLHLRSDLRHVRERIKRYGTVGSLALLGSLLVALILSTRMERVITGPILHLFRTVRDVSEKKDFSLRATRTTRDETGLLIDGFNDMLAQLQVRDATLQRMREALEARVKERTAELTRTNERLETEIAQRKAANAGLQQENAERRRAEAALREAELRYRQLVETVQAIVWRADANSFNFTFVSPEAEKLLGYPVEDWLADPSFWQDHLHAEDREWAADSRRKAAGVGRPHEIAYRMVAADGRVIWMRDLVSVIHRDGRPAELIGVMVDITRQKVAEGAVRESEERYRNLFESTPDAILIESEGDVVLLNPAAESLFGANGPEDLLGSSLLDRIHPASQEELHHRMRGLAAEGTGTFETTWARLDGSTIEVEVSVIPFTHRSRPGSQIVVRDITRRKEADRLKSEFVSTVSHELRTPLTAIRGSLGLLAAGKAGALPGAAKPLVEIANAECQRLVRLINDLLDVQKIEAGRMEFQMKPLEVMPLVERAIETNRPYGEQYGVRFRLVESVPDAVLLGDGDRLQQVLSNLLSNAAKFSPRGGTVDVAVERTGSAVRLCVRDRGTGIPAEFRGRIFQKFAQADGSSTRQKGGTGLGLSICKAIAERHGGTIGFDDAPGGGTVFHLEIPEHRPAPLPA